MNAEDLLLNFTPIWRKQLLNIMDFPNLVISVVPIKVHPYLLNYKREESINFANYFELEIPFAGTVLKWDVLLNEENYEFAPDFDFKSDMFLTDPDVDTIIEHIPSLLKWNINNPKAFRNVIEEFLQLYKKMQLDLFNTDQKYKGICTEYDLSITDTSFDKQNIEICANAKSVNMLIDLDISIEDSDIENSNDKIYLNPAMDKAMLKFSSLANKLVPTLYLTTHLEELLGNASTLIIPPLKKNTTMLEYTNSIKQLIKERMDVIQNRLKYRNDYTSSLLSALPLTLIEYDNKNFSKATFLMKHLDSSVLIHINISDKFPLEQPQIIFTSLSHERNNKPVFEELNDYPYSPRWSVAEMAKRLISHLPEVVQSFHDYCNNL